MFQLPTLFSWLWLDHFVKELVVVDQPGDIFIQSPHQRVHVVLAELHVRRAERVPESAHSHEARLLEIALLEELSQLSVVLGQLKLSQLIFDGRSAFR